MITQEINLNLIPSSDPVVVHMNQYDEGKGRLIAHLFNGSSPYVPVNATVKVQGTKPDDKAFQYYCDISGSTVTIDINIQMTAVAGRTPTQLIVTEYTGITGSFAFILDIQPSTLQPLIDVSETDLPIYTEEAQEAAQRAVQAASAAEQSAADAAAWSSNPPYIGSNDNWFVYDTTTEQFVDSGILARGTDGEDGERGSLWYRGTAVSGKSADPTVFPTGIADALPGDMYLNVTEGAIYHCVTGGSASVATWAYDFTLTGGGGGGGTDNYNDLINQPKINNVTLTGNKSSSDLGINSGIMLTSIMHIGGETQRTVQEALEALKDNGGGLYPYLYIDSEAGATVTVDAPDGSTIIPTPAGSGHWECELPAYGVYVIHSVLSGQGDATYSLTVDDVKEYHVTDSHYDFTINVIADAGSTIRVSAGTEVYTGTGTGSAVAFVVHQPSTVYTIEETLDGHTDSETVTSASTSGGSVTVTVHVFEAILSISTTSSSLFGKSISIMKDGVSVGSTAFNNSGQATYAVHETGIYTLTCDGYDASVTVTTETTYPVSILAGLDLASWISAGSTTEHPLNPSSYADFAALEADEEAIRQLMTVHASVDYLAQATAGDSLMEDVINSDECAKWINIQDYALNTLSDNSDIADVMDTADKYFYGEWVENNGTWGAKGNVPIMTSNTAPYGEAFSSSNYSGTAAWRVFRNTWDSSSGSWSPATANAGEYVGYNFINPVIVKKIKIGARYTYDTTFSLQGSNDGFVNDIHDLRTNITPTHNGDANVVITDYEIENNDAYLSYRLIVTSGNLYQTSNGVYLQFYGRELKPLVPVMTGDNAPKGEVIYSSQYNNTDYAGYKAFGDESQTKAWLPTASDANPYIGYKGNAPFNIKMFGGRGVSSATNRNTITWKIYGSDTGDANDWHDLNQTFALCPFITSKQMENLTMNGSYKCYKLEHLSHTTDGLTVGSGNMFYFYGFDYSEKEFATGSTMKYIYDHGVELAAVSAVVSGSGATATKESDELYAAMTTNNYPYYAYFITDNAIDFGTTPKYTTLNAHMGTRGNTSELYPYLLTSSTDNIGYALSNMTAHIKMGYVNKNLAPHDYSLDVSSLSGNQYVVMNWGGAGSSAYQFTGSVTEVWLE